MIECTGIWEHVFSISFQSLYICIHEQHCWVLIILIRYPNPGFHHKMSQSNVTEYFGPTSSGYYNGYFFIASIGMEEENVANHI